MKGNNASSKQKILDAAAGLFYTEGVRAVGVDRIAAESGVAKMTLYHHFGSKDELVAAWLRHRRPDAEWLAWLEAAVDRRDGNRLLVVFDALHEWLETTKCRGCAFINVHAELGGSNPVAEEVVKEHTLALTAFLARLAREEGADEPEAVARDLLLIIAGAIVAASIFGDAGPVDDARELAKTALVARGLAAA